MLGCCKPSIVDDDSAWVFAIIRGQLIQILVNSMYEKHGREWSIAIMVTFSAKSIEALSPMSAIPSVLFPRPGKTSIPGMIIVTYETASSKVSKCCIQEDADVMKMI